MYSTALFFITALVVGSNVVSAAPITLANDTLVTRYDECNRPGIFALTFDDGPAKFTYELAKSLYQQNIKATFFMNGNNSVDVLNADEYSETSDGYKSYLEVIRYVYDSGHEIASHTYDHINLVNLPDEQVRYQMNAQSDVIFRAIGRRPQLMRPPEGALDDNSSRVLKELGYSSVEWDIDTRDWEHKGLAAEQAVVQSIMDVDTPSSLGHIALMHDIHIDTVTNLVPWIVGYVKEKGLEFVTASDCIGVAAYAAQA